MAVDESKQMSEPTKDQREVLAALPIGAVVLDRDGDAWQQRSEGRWSCTERSMNTDGQPLSSLVGVLGPLIVVHPVEQSGVAVNLGGREVLAEWDLSDREIESVHEVMVDAGAWRLLELTMDTCDRSPSAEMVHEARDDIRKWLTARDAAVAAGVGERIAVAIEAIHLEGLDQDGLFWKPGRSVVTEAARIARETGAGQ